MTTLESAIEKRLADFRGKRRDDENLQADEIAYLLDIAPFIKRMDEPAPSATTTKGLHGIEETTVSRRSDLFLEYMNTVEGKVVDDAIRDDRDDDPGVCSCGEPMRYEKHTSTFVCQSCGMTRYTIEGTAHNLSYNDEVSSSFNTAYTYTRINHLCETLNSIQAKENTTIPTEVIDALKRELRKERHIVRKDIQPQKVKTILKKLDLARYYEHAPTITCILNGMPPPQFSRELEDKFKSMFIAMQAPFERHRPQGRKNFLNYHYVLIKLCEILGVPQYKKYFKLLKSPQKLFCHDQIWKKMCDELGWAFVPTV